MIEFCIATLSTVLEPRTATSTAAEFAGFLDSATLGAYATDHR